MTITEPTPTRPNLIDSAMSAELLERGEAGPIPDSLSTVHGPEAIVDEVRCRRLVIVDDEGTERIVAKTSDAGAVLTVSADGLDGLPVEVALVAGNQGSTMPSGGPYRIAGVQVTVGDGNDDERALLEVSQRETATNTIPVLTVGRTVFGDAGSCLDTEALVERLSAVERDVERIAGMLTITAAMHGTLKTGEETLRPLYRVDETRLVPLAERAAVHEARARALLAEVDALAAEQEADMMAAYQMWPSTTEGDRSRNAQNAPEEDR